MEWEVGILLLGIVFIIFALFSFGRARKKQSAGNPTAREHLERVKQRQGVRDDMNGLMVEIEQLARRVGAQLDAKTVHIEKAIREADERIAQLQALRDTAPAPGNQTGSSLPPPLPPAHTDPADRVAGGPLPLPESPPSNDHVATTPPPLPGADPLVDPLTQNVYNLADAGKAPQDIAHELQEHVGKVELILALRQA